MLTELEVVLASYSRRGHSLASKMRSITKTQTGKNRFFTFGDYCTQASVKYRISRLAVSWASLHVFYKHFKKTAYWNHVMQTLDSNGGHVSRWQRRFRWSRVRWRPFLKMVLLNQVQVGLACSWLWKCFYGMLQKLILSIWSLTDNFSLHNQLISISEKRRLLSCNRVLLLYA